MAKFCTKCGKKLVNGKCDCGVEKNIFSDLISIVKGFLMKPIDTLKENVNEDKFELALLAILSNSIIWGLFVCFLIKKLYSGITNVSNMFGVTSIYQIHMHIPYVKYFFMVVVLSAICMALMILISYAISDKLLNGKTSIKKMVTLFGFSSIILTVTLLLGIVLLLFSAQLAFIVIIASLLLNILYIYKGLEYASDTNINELGYVLMPTLVIVGLIISAFSKTFM